MSTGLLTLNEQKVPAEISDKNVINITINQESSLSYLFKAVGQCWARQQEPPQKTQQSPASAPKTACHSWLHCNGEQKVLGGAQILLGIVVISLGVVNDCGHLFYIRTGAPFWMGGLVMLSGALAILGERRAGFWAVAFAVKVLLLIFSVAALAIALFCLGYRLRVLCCTRKASSADSGAVGDLDVAPPDQDEAIIENIA